MTLATFARANLIALLLCCSAAYGQMGASLVPPSAATDTAAKSGSWQDATTWTDGTVPTVADRVLIPAGVTVTNHATADALWIHAAGKLTFCDHCDVRFNVHTIYVPMGGSFSGHATGKVVTEWLDGPFFPGDTTQLSRGLICHGEFMVSGVAKTAWCKVESTDLPSGATTLAAESTSGWQPGDRLVICGTDSIIDGRDIPQDPHRYQSEFVTIQSVSGNNVTFSPPLYYRHFRWRNDLPFHVGNLTRNVVFRSRDTSTIANRGHLMFMSSMCRMANVAVEGCGRTDGSRAVTDPRSDLYGEFVAGSDANVRARYAVHWHRVGQLSLPAICTGCVVDGSPKWGFLIHDSVVHLKDCIATRCFGSGFATEEGQERGSIDRCLSVLNRGMGDLISSTDEDHGRRAAADWGIDGSGFWFQGGGVSLTSSVACDNSGRGIGLMNRTMNGHPDYGDFLPQHLRYPIEVHGTLLPLDYSGVATTPTFTVPQCRCDGNTCYGNKVGLQGWSGNPYNAGSQRVFPLSVRGSIGNLTLWGRGAKLHLEYMRQVNVDGLKIVGDNVWRSRPQWTSINRDSEAVLFRGEEVTLRSWSVEGVEAHMRKIAVSGRDDPGGIAAKNIVIEGATVQPNGEVTIP